MSETINLIGLLAVLALAWCWLSEHNSRQHEVADYEARLAAAFSSLRHYQVANDTLAAEVRKRDAAIARHLARENAAAIARVATGQRRMTTLFVAGLPMRRVNPSQFNRN